MRLVSACYNSFYPFHLLNNVTGQEVADSPDFKLEKDDVLIVWGGADIPPEYYNKGRSSFSGAWVVPSSRDKLEWSLIQQAKDKGNFIIGVCRGAQMLCAVNGGFLYQHVDNHSGNHVVYTNDNNQFYTNSIHHQMMEPDGTDHELIAWTDPLTRVYMDVQDNEDVRRQSSKSGKDAEFIYFKGVRGAAVQWHPEMMREQCDATQYVLNFINNHA